MVVASWHSMSVYYYDTNKDDLLLDCIRPILQRLRERDGITRAYFMRHWEGGSHLCLNMFTERDIFLQKVVPYVEHEVGRYLLAHPSTGTLTEQEALEQYKRRAQLVLEELTYVPPVPNNSVMVTPYEALDAKIGSQSAAELLEDYYIETNDLVFKIIEGTRNNEMARLNASFDQLVARAATSSFLPIQKAYMSYRSHVEAYIVCETEVEDPDKRRQRLAEAYQARKKKVERRIKRLLTLCDQAPEQLPSWLSEVIAIHRRYDQLALQRVKEGTLKLKEPDEKLIGPSRENRLLTSEYHAAIANNPAVRIRSRQPHRIVHRTVLNFLYLHLIRIGMLNEYRYILDYYIAETLDELFGVSPVDLVTSLKDTEEELEFFPAGERCG